MEAELTALREELSTRSKNNNSSGCSKQGVANHSNLSNGNENSSSDSASVIKKPEKSTLDVKEEESNQFSNLDFKSPFDIFKAMNHHPSDQLQSVCDQEI